MTARSDFCTRALVLRRTKYGETDRILSLLTPEGKIDVIAKGIRRDKSRLAGGTELFCLSEVTIHQHRPSQGQGVGLATLTSAKMVQFYQNILMDLSRLELASSALKLTAKLSNQIADVALFDLLLQTFSALHAGCNLDLIEIYFLLNLAKIAGGEPNLYFDTTGAKLQPDQTYIWNVAETALMPDAAGKISANEIKLMRLMLSTPLKIVVKVQKLPEHMSEILQIAQSSNQM